MSSLTKSSRKPEWLYGSVYKYVVDTVLEYDHMYAYNVIWILILALPRPPMTYTNNNKYVRYQSSYVID